MNEKVDVEIAKRRLSVMMEGFTQIEVLTLANAVGEKIAEAARENEKIADSSKLAILAALDLAAELSRARDAHETAKRIVERKVDELVLELQKALSAAEK